MTSEVVVMNRLGIALAADSAATIYTGDHAKVYHADKLFMLSYRHPVGVMTYNNSALLGVPWEVIIKLFRRKLGDQQFDTLAEYADALFAFLDDNEHLFPAEVQKRIYLELVETLYRGISKGINDVVMEMINDGNDSPQAHKKAADEVILNSLAQWRMKENVTCFPVALGEELAGQFSGEITNLVGTYFGVWQLEGPSVNALRQLAIFLVSKDEILDESLTGLVVAGYGAQEYFPVMRAFELGAVFRGKVKRRLIADHSIDSTNSAVVRPFAESNMVLTFLNGVSPTFEIKLIDEISNLVVELPELVIDQVTGVGSKRKKLLKEHFQAQALPLVKDLVDKLEKYRLEQHLEPIRQAIAFLPKNELAQVAATLVNLNSFQKRMSIAEDETVGGPVDVAVISKGDGFVWIERKHYFPPKLNPHFFANYRSQFTQQEEEAKDEKKEEEG